VSRRPSWTHTVRAEIRAVTAAIEHRGSWRATASNTSEADTLRLQELRGQLHRMRDTIVGDYWHASRARRWESLRRDLATAVHRTRIGKPRGSRRYLSLHQW
jgi:hypothetical protein